MRWQSVIGEIKEALLATPGVSEWPELGQLVERPFDEDVLYCWDYPVIACRAVGGEVQQAVPGAAAVFCLLHSIRLVDDMLDEDPGGAYRKLGGGRAANLALALQAAASRLMEKVEMPPERRSAVLARVAKISLDTAYGQELDVGELSCEEDYWQVVDHKTPPLFAGALYIGAVLGQASFMVADEVALVGELLGKLIQISDDIKDAVARPAETDWQRPYSNLPILYALSADHPARERFQELLRTVASQEASLVAAQDILVRSGAVSFCVYRIVETFREARQHLSTIDLASPEPLVELLDYYLRPVHKLFKTIGVESPEDLLRK